MLADISQTRSDHAKSVYLKELFKQKTLDGPTLGKALQQAGREIQSDYDLAQVLMFASESQPIDGALTAVHRRVTQHRFRLRRTQCLQPRAQPAVDHAGARLADLEGGDARSRQCRDLIGLRPGGGADWHAGALVAQDASGWFAAVNSIESSYDCRRVIASVVRPGVAARGRRSGAEGCRREFNPTTISPRCSSTSSRDGGLTDRTAPSFFAALPKIESDYEHRRVLQAVAAASVSDGALAQATATTAGMNSDYDRAESLVAISRSKAVGPSTRKALADAASGIGSEHDRGRVLSALTRAGVLTAR